MKILFPLLGLVLLFSNPSFAKRHIASSIAPAVDPLQLCSAEAEKRLLKLELKGNLRFSEIKVIADTMTSSDVEYTDLGGNARRGRRKRKKDVPPAKQQFGQLLVIKAVGKEKTGWRNLSVRCGINKGKIATFTYEILDLDNKSI